MELMDLVDDEAASSSAAAPALAPAPASEAAAEPVVVRHVPAFFDAEPWDMELTVRLSRLEASEASGGSGKLERLSGGCAGGDAVDADAVEWWRSKSQNHKRLSAEEREQQKELEGIADLACCCISADFRLRMFCIRVARSKWFDRIVLVLILLNSVIMAVQDPTAPETKLTIYSELVFNLVFTVEMSVKMLGLGVCHGKSAYFRDPWNRFDFFTVVCGWLPLVLEWVLGENSGMINLTYLRVVRVVKVLKTVQRMPGMRCLVLSLAKSAPLLVQVMEVLLFIFFVFGVIGVQLFSGKLRQHCFDERTRIMVSEDAVCTKEGGMGGNHCGNGEVCRDRDFEGVRNVRSTSLNRYISFDNILLGSATVLTTVSLEGWSQTMYALMDALGPAVVIYFVLLVLVGAFFVVNLIVAVIYQAYVTEEAGTEVSLVHEVRAHFDLDPADAARAEADGLSAKTWKRRPAGATLALTLGDVLFPDRCEDLAHFRDPQRTILKYWWRLRDVCCFIATLRAFDRGILLAIIFNTVVLMAEYEGQSAAHERFSCVANTWLTWIFVGEMVIKMLGTSYVFHPTDGHMNLFDGIITVGSIADMVYSFVSGNSECAARRADGSGAEATNAVALHALKVGRILRLVRIFRSLRMVRSWKSMSHILSAVMRSGPGLVNFSCLLVMFSWVYALAGMQMYAGKFQTSLGLTETRPRMTFDSLHAALLTVFIVVSGENWDTVLDYAFRANGYIGLVFIISMYLIGNFLVLNIFLAILLSNFEMSVDSSNATLYDELEQSNEITAALKAVAQGAKRVLVMLHLRSASSATYTSLSRRVGLCCGGARVEGSSPRESEDGSRCGSCLRRAASAPLKNLETLEHYVEAHVRFDVDDEACEPAVEQALEEIVVMMQEEIATGTHHRGRREFHDCFPGSVAVDWILETDVAASVEAATDLGQRLLDAHLIAPTDLDVTSRFSRMIKELEAKKDNGQTYAACVESADEMLTRLKTPSQVRRLSVRTESALELREVEAASIRLAAEATCSSRAAIAARTFRDNHQLYRFCARNTHRLNIVGDPAALQSRREAQTVRDRRSLRRRMATGTALGVFGPRNTLRQLAINLVTLPSFDFAIGVLIVVSSVVLAATNPNEDARGNPARRRVLHVADLTLTILFLGELVVKVIAAGLGPYLASGWNVLDAFIVAVSVASVALTGHNLSYLKALRALRALRPLRMIQRYPAMKTVVDALMEAVPDVMNVALVVVGFFCIFAVAGGTLFRGLLSFCHVSRKTPQECRKWGLACSYGATDGDFEYVADAARYGMAKSECRAYWKRRSAADGGIPWNHGLFDPSALSSGANYSSPLRAEWRSTDPHFDNLGEALLALFEVATLEGWPAFMFAAMDVTEGRESPPRRDAAPVYAIFYVVFVVIGSFFVMNIFVGVVVHKFQLAKERTEGASIFLTEQQRGFVDRVKVLLDAGQPVRLRVPSAPWRQNVFYVVVSERFEMLIIGVIVLNMGAICLNHYDQSAAWDEADFCLNVGFALAFLVEMILKLVGLGAPQYFRDPWNRFDAFIVLTSVVDGISTADIYDVPLADRYNLSLFRILRLARVVKLVNVNPGLKTLLKSLIVSLPSLMNVGSLLVLLIFVYACIGMNLYHDVAHGEFITNHCNFGTFGYSMLTLFRCLTGEDWHKIMQAIVDDGNRVSAYPFFSTFIILGNFMMLNLCVAVILEAFAEFMNADSEDERRRSELRANVAAFKKVWMDHDEDNTMFIPAYRIVAFLQDLPPPMGLPTGTETVDHAGRLSFVGIDKRTPPAEGNKPKPSGGARPPSPPAEATDAKGGGVEWDFRLDAKQRFLIEFVRNMRIKINETGDLFYLDVLMAAIHNGREVDLSNIEEDSTMELNIMLLRCMEPRLRRKMKHHCFRHDLPELDLTHTLNATITLQEIYRAKKQRVRSPPSRPPAGKRSRHPSRQGP